MKEILFCGVKQWCEVTTFYQCYFGNWNELGILEIMVYNTTIKIMECMLSLLLYWQIKIVLFSNLWWKSILLTISGYPWENELRNSRLY